MIRALVFDFDGVILETEGPIYRAWQEIFEEHGRALSRERWGGLVGTSEGTANLLDELERHAGRPLDRSGLTARRRARQAAAIAGLPVLPGVEAHLRDARAAGMKLAIASSSSRAWVVGHLERLGLAGWWDCVRCRDDVVHGKPAPDLFLAAADCLGVAPAEAIAFEDSHHGVTAAVAAGLRCVACPGPMTSGLDLSRAELRVSSLDQMSLADIITALERRAPPSSG